MKVENCGWLNPFVCSKRVELERCMFMKSPTEVQGPQTRECSSCPELLIIIRDWHRLHFPCPQTTLGDFTQLQILSFNFSSTLTYFEPVIAFYFHYLSVNRKYMESILASSIQKQAITTWNKSKL